jgi:hypothetical protein
MVAPVDVANMALGLCGARSVIASFAESNPESAQAAIWYDRDRLWLLRAHRWNFAREQGPLTLIATAPGIDGEPFTNLPWPFMPWSYSYAMPSDCVQFRSIIPSYNMQPIQTMPLSSPQPPVPFVVSSTLNTSAQIVKAIFTNQVQAIGIWTRDIVNPDLWDSQFMEAMSYRLAASLTIPLSGDKALANALFQKCKEVLMEAEAKDGNEGLTVASHIPDWLRVRGFAADYDYYPWWGGAGWGDWTI